MQILPDDEFLAWFFTYFLDDAICPHCQSVICQDEIQKKGKDFVVCPHCNGKINKDDLGD